MPRRFWHTLERASMPGREYSTMNNLSRTEAQRRADQIHVFREEMSRLATEGVVTLTDEQRGA
ncbi:MAG TPA: hypothetical protein VKB34_12135, partial [Povalibacter sp.]|nr:hypothetical protein [Povalibacter sp.]